MKKIWSLGISMLDIITTPINKWPEKGGAVNAEMTNLAIGGTALNTAVTIAKLGGVPVGLISCIGKDIGGEIIKTGLSKLNIDSDHMYITDKANTGSAICFIHPDGERSFVLCVSANNELDESIIDFDVFHNGDFLHIGGAMAMKKTQGDALANIARRAKELDVTVSVDTCWDVTDQWKSNLAPCLPYCDILMTNEEEAKRYSGKDDIDEAIEYFVACGSQIIIAKMGNKGAYIYSSEFKGLVPNFKVKTVDATGAGDSFAGGFLFSRYHNWSVEQSGTFACAVGAKCVTSFGATTGIVSSEETIELINSQSRTASWKWK
jgi:sugar/nucleoside kinase (ribokinase family)